MILRRFIAHFRRQDWLAVLLDICVVIVGIFLGMQVTEWNEQRKEALRANQLIARLHEEVVALQATRERRFGYISERRADLMSLRPLVVGAIEADALTGRQCSAIASSDGVLFPPTQLAVISELLSSGQFNLLRDVELKQRLMAYETRVVFARELHQIYAQQVTNLPNAYPNIIEWRLVADPTEGEDDGWDRRSHCDLQRMVADIGFRNSFLENVDAIDRSYDSAYLGVSGVLAEVHGRLDDLLGLSH
jgi:hypothetical protein